MNRYLNNHLLEIETRLNELDKNGSISNATINTSIDYTTGRVNSKLTYRKTEHFKANLFHINSDNQD